jgi:hypothetical protein
MVALTGLILAPVASVLAIDLPDNITIPSAKVYHNLAVTGDMLVVYHGKFNYDSDNGTYPTIPASSSVILRFIADNGTILASASPYVYSPFDNSGYGDFVSGFYFEAADVPTWLGAHTINILGTPAYFSPAQTFSYTLTPSDYNSSNTTAVNQLDLYTEIIRLADVFHNIYPDVSLKSITDIGTVLSSYGEAYFKSAIPGLLELCPALFYVQVYVPEVMPVEEYDTSLGDTYSARMVGTDLARGAERLGDKFGVAGSFIWGIVAFSSSVFIMVKTAGKGWGIEPGLLLSGLIVILIATLFGDFMFKLMMIIGLVSAIGIMYVWALRRA